MPFAASTPVPEASGAAWRAIDGKLSLVVVGDSGNDGAYGVIDPETGETGEQGKLPLGGGGDDIEGVATVGDTIYGLTSDGVVRHWRRGEHGFSLVDGPYSLGVGDRNFEGLCLAGESGYAASKADGHLYRIELANGRLVLHRDGALAVTGPRQIGDCTYGDDGTLWVGGNLHAGGQIWRVVDGKAIPIAKLGLINPEVIAVRGDLVYRMTDTNAAPSLMAKFRCTPGAR